jgi:hypothetical protein
MSNEIKGHQEKPLHELLDTILSWNVFLQLKGTEVAKPYIQGRPGGGKTASMISMCAKYGWNLFHLHLPLIPIEDISGLPQFEKIMVNGEMVEGTRWTFPEMLSEIYKLTSEVIKDPKSGKEVPKPCIVFLDDMHLASPSHLALGFELFSERKLRTYKIPDNVAFVLAGNASTKAGTKTQNSAVTNRLALYPVHTSYDHWKTEYAYPNGINDKIMSFLSRDTYKQFFHEDEVVNKAWGSPRSWTYLSNLLNEMENASSNGEVDQSILSYITNAHVSGSASSQFVSFYHIYSKTQMDKIYDGIKSVKCPEDELDKYIYMIAAGNEFVNRNLKEKDRNKKTKIMEKLCEITCAISKHNSEIAISGIKSLMDMERAIAGKDNAKTSYIEIARTLKVMGSNISGRVSADIRKIAASN